MLRCEVVLSRFYSNSSDSTAKFGATKTEHASEMELVIILATLENFERWNQTLLITKSHFPKQSRFSVLLQW